MQRLRAVQIWAEDTIRIGYTWLQESKFESEKTCLFWSKCSFFMLYQENNKRNQPALCLIATHLKCKANIIGEDIRYSGRKGSDKTNPGCLLPAYLPCRCHTRETYQVRHSHKILHVATVAKRRWNPYPCLSKSWPSGMFARNYLMYVSSNLVWHAASLLAMQNAQHTGKPKISPNPAHRIYADRLASLKQAADAWPSY